jgi:hypothetical protein
MFCADELSDIFRFHFHAPSSDKDKSLGCIPFIVFSSMVFWGVWCSRAKFRKVMLPCEAIEAYLQTFLSRWLQRFGVVPIPLAG